MLQCRDYINIDHNNNLHLMPSTDPRLQTLQHWLSEHWPRPLHNLRAASSDASFRRYFRADDEETPHSLIVMDAPPRHEDCRPFISVTGLLRDAGVHAPKILAQDVEQGFLLLEDLGNTTYLQRLPQQADELYSDAIDALIRMQTIRAQLPVYDEDLLQDEMQLFEQWYCNTHLGVSLSAKQQAVLHKATQQLIDSALSQPQVFVHRDYHSRNLMICDDNNPGVIDYQDAVIGPLSYDLVSLFKDCYIGWPRHRVEQWLELYWQRSGMSASYEQLLHWFDWTGVQRHLKVLGIFARLHHRDGKAQYLDDMPLTHKYLIDACTRYAPLHPLHDLLQTLTPA